MQNTKLSAEVTSKKGNREENWKKDLTLYLYLFAFFTSMYSWITCIIKKRICSILKYFQNPLQVKMLKQNTYIWLQGCVVADTQER